MTKSVEIMAGLEKPLILEAVKSTLEGKITYQIEEIEKGKTFKVHIANAPGVTDNFSGFLDLKTNYKERSIINIKIFGKFVKKKSTEE